MMVITIVTPSYNQGTFLAATIESVISQKGDFFIDYVIVDGQSCDDSVAIIQNYHQKITQGKWPIGCRGIDFRWSSEPDKGQADAIRKGFSQSRGTVLAWLNSDDMYLPDTLQTISAFFNEHSEIELLYGDCNYCDETGTVIAPYPVDDFDLSRLASFNFIPQPSTFFRREAYDAAGGLDDTLRYALDYDLTIRICKRFRCQRVPHLLSLYRLHEHSKTLLDRELFDNHEEGLQTVLKHFGWAPLNLIYGSCLYFCRCKLPSPFSRIRLFLIITSILCTMFRSLRLNRGINLRDLKLLNHANFRKIFKERREILLGRTS